MTYSFEVGEILSKKAWFFSKSDVGIFMNPRAKTL